ncbi:hypothetical protein ACL655_26085, partial [Klebsiella quasipneumoniae subsp. similipneumoniae]
NSEGLSRSGQPRYQNGLIPCGPVANRGAGRAWLPPLVFQDISGSQLPDDQRQLIARLSG